MKKIKEIGGVIVQSFKNFGKDKIPKYSAALAYTTVFSLGPLLIVIIFFMQHFLWARSDTGKNI
jgi:membrane protein